MNKKYLMKGVAALALFASFTSCTKDVTAADPIAEEQSAIDNAEMQLGITIPDNQTWNMASQVTASVTVNGDYGANYTVSIYENNPFINNTAVVLGKEDVVSGGTATINFTCPDASPSVFVAIKDEKGYTYTKPAAISDGKLETTFGGESAAGARRASNRGADDFTIAERTMPDLSTYINDAVAITAENNSTGQTEVTHYLIPEGTEWSANIPLLQSGNGISVYVQGTLNITAEQRVNGGCVFIVGPKGTVNIADGVQLVTNANNEESTVGSFYVYPGGTVQGEGTLEFANGTGSYNYNGGTIDVGTLNNNGGTLYNAGVIEADVLEGGAGNSVYENAGKVHIGNMVYGSSSANTRIRNNCWWEVDDDLCCRNIMQGPGAYIKATNMVLSCSEDNSGETSFIYAKANSLIDITGTVSLNNVDIDGPTTDGDYAYLQFGSIGTVHDVATNYTTAWGTVNGTYQEYMTVGAIQNNIRLSVDNPDISETMQNKLYNPTAYEKVLNMLNGTKSYTTSLADPSCGWKEYPQQGNGNAILVQKGQYTAATVEESDCSPGIDIVPPTPIYETLNVYTYAFEDQTVGTDYDMNDVVLKVSYHVTAENEDGQVVYDKTQLDATLVAAGATYNIKVKIGNNYLFGGKEIHEALGVNSGVMVNTGNGKATTASPVPDLGIAIPSGWDGDFTQLPVSIEVTSTGDTYSYPNTDNYPHAVMIPTDWRWPKERIIVTEAYPGTSDAATVAIGSVTYPENSFSAWAATLAAERTDVMKSWYNYPNTGKTMTNTTE